MSNSTTSSEFHRKENTPACLEFDIALLSSRDDHSSPLRKAMGHEKHSLSYTAPIRANRGSYGSTEHNHEGRELDYEEKKRKKKKEEKKKN